MKANELRIGNWVKDQTGRVGHIMYWKSKNMVVIKNEYSTTSDHVDYYEPIPLTEEWLERFGFVKRIYDSEETGYGYDFVMKHYEKYGASFMIVYESDFSMTLFSDDDEDKFGITPNFKKARYVHQLQNLYFALTGEELELKEKVK